VKKIVIAALVAAQVGGAIQPAAAATLDPTSRAERIEAGAFAGARLRLQLGGQQERASAGLTLAPMRRSGDGRAIGFRTGAGVEFGFTSSGKRPMLTLAGRPVTKKLRLAAKDDNKDGGISTLAIVGIGVGVLVIGALLALDACADGDICGSDRDD
jgi:hypothetical protein